MKFLAIRVDLVPSGLANAAKILVKDISGHDTVDEKLAKSFSLLCVLKDVMLKVFKAIRIQHVPSNIDRVLLSNTLVRVLLCQFWMLDSKLVIWYTRVSNIMDQSRKNNRETSKWVTGNSRTIHASVDSIDAIHEKVGEMSNVAGVLEVVEVVRFISRCNSNDEVSEFSTNMWWQIGSGSEIFSSLALHFDGHLDLVHWQVHASVVVGTNSSSVLGM
mmetsp:Transcript_22486/g.55639  ORF Transcript_22486/g.55639 Transcript_22486/m.55639 type:complete len:217 (+) Transcript_22486:978-1628(+)